MGKPTVHILLATYQGQAYLQQQLDSIANQSYVNWELLISDDGSTDSTLEIAAAFAHSVQQRVQILSGPGKGVTHNFFHLIHSVGMIQPMDLYGFCDQDDVWLPFKLERAMSYFTSQSEKSENSYLYCSRSHIVDHQLNHLGMSACPRKAVGFGNALLQNIASGNTMIFNLVLLNILRRINPADSVLHDWTAYQAATGAGGVVIFDKQPTLLYRQHNANVVGANQGFKSQWHRIRFMLGGGYRLWSDKTEAAMASIKTYLTKSSVQTLDSFAQARSRSHIHQRFYCGVKVRVWRQSRKGQISFWFALAFKLI